MHIAVHTDVGASTGSSPTLAVLNVTAEGLVLRETAPDVTAEDVVTATEADLIVTGTPPEMVIATKSG